ncbi:hypothetical protein MESS2_130029 [Mesorhizobium metallidurans STM 2683]|uniref:Uncharacterized protein n=1 Tax=Mesorhizobium metallidurans STM 2683 TaxID=1297569 RepID=M5EJC7_9HYPH|nr:hypothetical protein MESS2_130029 [Mesorhizobium metallidurans STM 2683]
MCIRRASSPRNDNHPWLDRRALFRGRDGPVGRRIGPKVVVDFRQTRCEDLKALERGYASAWTRVALAEAGRRCCVMYSGGF